MPDASVALAADIGGTNARFMLVRAAGAGLDAIARAKLRVATHASFEDALAAFLASHPAFTVDRACIAIAGPVEGRVARLTNSPWKIDADAVAARFGMRTVQLCNDFAAAAAGIDDLDSASMIPIQQGHADRSGARLVIGAGTGLGVAYVLRDGSRSRVVASEGGHVGFAPADDEQILLLRSLVPTLGRVSAERLVSGEGLVRLYQFASGPDAGLPDDLRDQGASAVTRRFAEGDPVAREALRMFASIFGAVAGDHALSVVATGGVYLAGGIAPRFRDKLADGDFTVAFNAKGRHSALMQRIPVWLVCDDGLGLNGAARCALSLPAA